MGKLDKHLKRFYKNFKRNMREIFNFILNKLELKNGLEYEFADKKN